MTRCVYNLIDIYNIIIYIYTYRMCRYIIHVFCNFIMNRSNIYMYIFICKYYVYYMRYVIYMLHVLEKTVGDNPDGDNGTADRKRNTGIIVGHDNNNGCTTRCLLSRDSIMRPSILLLYGCIDLLELEKDI